MFVPITSVELSTFVPIIPVFCLDNQWNYLMYANLFPLSLSSFQMLVLFVIKQWIYGCSVREFPCMDMSGRISKHLKKWNLFFWKNYSPSMKGKHVLIYLLQLVSKDCIFYPSYRLIGSTSPIVAWCIDLFICFSQERISYFSEYILLPFKIFEEYFEAFHFTCNDKWWNIALLIASLI